MSPTFCSQTSTHRRVINAKGMKVISTPILHRGAGSSTSSISDESTHSADWASSSQASKDGVFPSDVTSIYSSSRLHEVMHRKPWEIQDSIIDTIGQTPIVKLNRMSPPGVDVFVKVESKNPGGSLKDRLAMGVIEWAEANGKLKPGQTIVEASSGNTGIGMAMVCAAKGYPFVCVMSESFSIERRKIMRFYGAMVVLTKAEYKSTGMLIKAQELADTHGYFYPKQFENEANSWIHQHTTGAEIVKAFTKSGLPLDHFFMSYGTGGTFLGISRAFKKARMSTKIHLCEPANAPMVSSGIETKYPAEGKGLTTSFDSAHPLWSPHLIQGWATDFIPKLIATAKKENRSLDVVHVSSLSAVETSKALAKKEGIFTGISGGGILAAALALARESKPGTTILCILPDTGERYLSTALFDDIATEMTPQEQALSDSTVGQRPPVAPPLSGIMPADTDELFDL